MNSRSQLFALVVLVTTALMMVSSVSCATNPSREPDSSDRATNRFLWMVYNDTRLPIMRRDLDVDGDAIRVAILSERATTEYCIDLFVKRAHATVVLTSRDVSGMRRRTWGVAIEHARELVIDIHSSQLLSQEKFIRPISVGHPPELLLDFKLRSVEHYIVRDSPTQLQEERGMGDVIKFCATLMRAAEIPTEEFDSIGKMIGLTEAK